MLFSTPLFMFVFLPLFFILYALAGTKSKNYVALFGSLLFYAWGESTFIFVVILSIGVDWFLGNLIYKYREVPHTSARFLFLGVACNVGLLGYFKYSNFFVENINHGFAALSLEPWQWAPVALPIGISFIVFEKITYLVDLYKRAGTPARTLASYALYILLFPKLLAGPIIKYHDIADQLYERKHDLEGIVYGIVRFIIGFAKKVLLADPLSKVADAVFALPEGSLTLLTAWIGILGFTLQIYFDFSGYSDMAIGMARVMGFRLSENFNMPYISSNFTEFWRRWHISLSTWIKNYLYIPLGGNQKSSLRMYFNLWFCFFISGLWHGANWTFVVWGLYHGLFLCLDKVLWLKYSARLPRTINIGITFILVMVGWVFFRATSIDQAFHFLYTMFNFNANFELIYLSNSSIFTLGIAFALVLLPNFLTIERGIIDWIGNCLTRPYQGALIMLLSVVMLFFSLMATVGAKFNPFIYFRF